MTVLSACAQAAKLMGFGTLSAIYSSTDPFAIEIGAVANEAATDIAKRHDWRKLMVLHTENGDGSTTAFDLPSDFDRMPIKAGVFLSSSTRPMTPVNDLDIWLDHRLRTFGDPEGEWIILGGQLNIQPAMASTDSAKYYYISNLIVQPSSGSNKTSFTADTDTFRLPERLLTLAVIWRWRAMKGYEYAEDMQNFEIALAQEIVKEKGSRIIRTGRARFPADVELAFRGTIEAS